uniref:CYP74Q1 n=1 Tax=Ranunculus acris TaxID=3447 RepID=A0A0D4L589_RANAC|nr:CYP74Q1 [Ranunculus acris]
MRGITTFFNSTMEPATQLPLREIPGSYGIPFFGAIKDRRDYLYNYGGIDGFFKAKIAEHNSTVFRYNMFPGPFIASDSKCVVLLDAKSFPVLYETDKVDKERGLLGTFMPDLDFYGGYVPLAYQDTSNPFHNQFKAFFLNILGSRHHKFVPLFKTGISELFDSLESEIAAKKSADFNTLNRNITFDYIFRLAFDTNPTDTKLGSDGPGIIANWFNYQVAPIAPSLGIKYLPHFIEDLIHTFRLPFALVKSDYKKLTEVIYDVGKTHLDEAEKLGMKRDEAVHNLIMCLFFNGSTGFRVFYPIMFKWIGLAGESLHKRIADEVRSVVAESGDGTIALAALEKMSLVKSVVWEAFRIQPPVTNQCGRAKKDLIVQSHTDSFEIKKGGLIYGYQLFATNDEKIFGSFQEFVPDRFVGEEAQEKLLPYVLWSGGRETDMPMPENKQCPGKNLVLTMTRLIVAEFFLRYDTYTIEEGSEVTITSLKKA